MHNTFFLNRMAIRGYKGLMSTRRNLFTVLVVVVLTVFVTLQVFGSTYWCHGIAEQLPKKKRGHEPKNIDPKVLAELKRAWFLEYEEEKKLNENENMMEVGVDSSKSGVKGAAQPPVYLPIDCIINGDRIVSCIRHKDSDEIFMPWEFVRKYFEVYGKIGHYDGYDKFEFSHTYSEVYYDPEKQYHFDGVFMTFETYNVEVRDRVKLITGPEGVPLSTQWGPQGYFYPIQIAQFAMSHYSKNITDKPPTKTVYEDGLLSKAKWNSLNSQCHVESTVDPETKSKVVQFETPSNEQQGNGVTLTLGNTVDFELSLDVKFLTNGSITVVVDATDKKKYRIHYLTDGKNEIIKERSRRCTVKVVKMVIGSSSGKLISYDKDGTIWYNIGSRNGWRHFSRNLLVDLKKGIGMTNSKAVKKVKIGIKKVVSLTLCGHGLVDNIGILTAEHMTHFLDGSYWLLKNQDALTGGWPIMIERRLEGFETLAKGWHSAMAQGHGLSTMVRAYKHTKDPSFLVALRKALQPFTISSSEGGVRAIFMNKYVWYEEYPTTPSSFVLNGFIFSLLGLYDYKMLLSEEKSARSLDKEDEAALILVTELYDTGMASLKNMLPLYDAGFTTIYDLRHYQLKTQPNLARWDYHATHVSQLALLATIDDDPIFQEFHGYWMGYTKGKRAKHN